MRKGSTRLERSAKIRSAKQLLLSIRSLDRRGRLSSTGVVQE